MLWTFDREQWPADDDRAAFKLWQDAGREFARVHGWPGGVVALIGAQRQERARVLGDSERP